MMEPKHRRKLRQLQADGYLKRDNPLTTRVLATLHAAAETAPEWYLAFLEMSGDGEGPVAEKLNRFIAEEDMVTVPLYVLLGRNDPDRTDTKQRVLACWLRRGLGARVKDVALELDVDMATVSRVRTQWEWEIRALLNDALCLGLTGEDLYHSVMTPHYEPTRLMERIVELRKARSNSEVLGPLPGQFEEELRDAWFDYRTKEGFYGRSPDMPINPPRWFVKQLLGD